MQGRTVLVTGVGVGLGKEVAAAHLDAGANVVIGARSADRLAVFAKELDPTGERILAHRADITDDTSCEELVRAAVQRFGALHAVVQVAAYEDAWGGLFDSQLPNWTKAFDTNVVGALRLLRAAVPALKDAGGGSIVFIGTQSSFKPALPQAGYSASKGALLTTMHYLADELGPDNIRVNTVIPGWMWGPNVEMFVDYRAKSEKKTRDDVLGEITGTFPLRRMAEDREVADATVFFASDLSRAITNQHLMVNCGDLSR
ncbi:short-chain dehydrogenase [Mycobacterium kubicae]|nr:SDR family oxidoreductase [Mycobacterium kubicae]ORV99000.1 short-chain dehydrogenase [Mycobacterium kubicae]QNI14510.1 SDR family oxidoreductase [Mycobacterium kubicae]QPI40436.1 SDR family oxidoreductase [Mycobacterium kubicae]